MKITQKLGNTTSFHVANRSIDVLLIEWFEVNKRIMHKKTASGRELVMKFLGEGQSLTEGDVLWQDKKSVVVVGIKPCEAIIIRPSSMREAAAICYEIGNKHLPVFYYEDEILVPFEAPLFKLLATAGYAPQKEMRRLLHPLKTTVSAHGHTETGQSLFSKILQLTSPTAHV